MAGNLLVAHGGGPTAVINCSLYGVIVEARRSAAIRRVLGARHGIAGVLRGDIIDLTDEPNEIIEGLRTTPASAIGSCRHKVVEEDYERIFEVLHSCGVTCLLYNGGNDSMDTALKIHQRARDMRLGLRVAGIPKTIDNDLAGTDHTPGFPSAARYFASLVRDLGRDIEALPTPVSVCEVMGRNAGWLTAATIAAREGEGDAPHLVYAPEAPVSKDRFLAQMDDLLKRLGRAVVTVSEGARDEQGRSISTSAGGSNVDGFGHPLPGGAAAAMADWVSTGLGVRARSEKPGLAGRASIMLRSEIDVREAVQVGKAAVQYVASGRSGHMMGIRRLRDDPYEAEIVAVPLEEVANAEHALPPEYLAGEGEISDRYLTYLRPLLGGPWPPYVRLAIRSGRHP